MSEVQKEALGAPKNLWALVEQYKQIEQAFNTRIAEIVKNVLPKDFDMSNIRGLDSVFQELNSPQNLRKEWPVIIPANSGIEARSLMDNILKEIFKVTSETWIFDNGVWVKITKSLDRVILLFSFLPESTKDNKVNSTVWDTSQLIKQILWK